VLLFASPAFLLGCAKKDKTPKKGKSKKEWRRKARPRPVHAIRVQSGNIAAILSGTTTLEAEDRVTRIAQVSGQVKRIYAQEGKRVRKGSLLALLSNPYLHIAYERVKGEVKKLTEDLKVQKKLLRKGAVSKETTKSLGFQLAQAKNQLKKAREDIRNLRITATISGIVSQKHLRRGSWINPGTKAFELEEPRSLVAKIALPEKYLPKLRKKQKAKLFAEALGRKVYIEGEVIRIAPVIDPKTGTISVVIGKLTLKAREKKDEASTSPKTKKRRFKRRRRRGKRRRGKRRAYKKRKAASSNKKASEALLTSAKLRSGMFVTVNLILEERFEVPLVPKQSVMYARNKPYVYRLVGPRKLCKPEKLDQKMGRKKWRKRKHKSSKNMKRGKKGKGKKGKKKPNCKVERAYFTKGLEDARMLEAIGGVRPGDRIVTLGHEGLREGNPVKVSKLE